MVQQSSGKATQPTVEEAEQQRDDAFVPSDPPPPQAKDDPQPLNPEGTGTPLKPGRRGKYTGKTSPTHNV